jgi:hypothetical protein
LAAAGPLAIAQRFRAAKESSIDGGEGREAPSLAARSAASLPGTLVCPGTQEEEAEGKSTAELQLYIRSSGHVAN